VARFSLQGEPEYSGEHSCVICKCEATPEQ
jgi:hypothetical protein